MIYCQKANLREARSLVDAIKKHDAEELENKASEEQPEEDKVVEETKVEEKEEQKEPETEEQPEEQPKDEEKRSLEQEGEERKYGKSSVRWKRNLSARNRSSWIFKLCTFS